MKNFTLKKLISILTPSRYPEGSQTDKPKQASAPSMAAKPRKYEVREANTAVKNPLPAPLEGKVDPFFIDAALYIIENSKVYTSTLQHALSIGYNRTSKIIPQLEKGGVIAPRIEKTPLQPLMSTKEEVENVNPDLFE